jgi:selenocysteine lyase/cysteine desulfurase
MEHHSNDLPWRQRARVNYVRVDDKGRLDLDDLQKKMKINYPKVKLLAICGASNVTGHVNDIYYIAEMAHEFKSRIMVDGAQLVPHRAINMRDHSDPPTWISWLFPDTKIYAPYGVGVLIGPYEFFYEGRSRIQRWGNREYGLSRRGHLGITPGKGGSRLPKCSWCTRPGSRVALFAEIRYVKACVL